jgi:hypothetical protein
MSDRIITDRPFTTNGQTIPAGEVSTEMLQEILTVPTKGNQTRHITEDEAKDVQQDLIRRQKHYNSYTRGITERHEHIQDSGKMAVGGGADA